MSAVVQLIGAGHGAAPRGYARAQALQQLADHFGWPLRITIGDQRREVMVAPLGELLDDRIAGRCTRGYWCEVTASAYKRIIRTAVAQRWDHGPHPIVWAAHAGPTIARSCRYFARIA